MNKSKENTKDSSEQVAVIGMSGEFPKSKTLEAFWDNLLHARELITFFSGEELEAEGTAKEVIAHQDYVPAKGYLDNCTDFDSDLFGYSPRESEFIDPQQRKLLTWSWIALENAGYDPNQFDGLIGAFISASLSSYFYFNIFPRLQSSRVSSSDEMLAVMGNEKDFLATRLSYKLNLTGPSKTIQTACSSSLVAVHDACQSLLSYETDLALAGGVSITFPLKSGYYYVKDGIRSHDGHCRPFDADSSGTLSGNGGGIVVLKRLNEALRDKDTILAIIRGSAINNDGANKAGFTAPSIQGQTRVIAAAHLTAEVHPESITYLETHGTGTQLGDAIESSALSAAFKLATSKESFCAIGSVKANIGHLDAAAGIAGLIKTILMLQSKKIPKLIHFTKPNIQASFANSPFFPALETLDWKNDYYPLRAGISSFGIGGTNAHLILEAPPSPILSDAIVNQWHLIVFSATNIMRLKELLKIHLENFSHCKYSFEDIAFTLQVGRKALSQRIFFCCNSLEHLYKQIELYLNNQAITLPANCPQNLYNLGEKWVAGEFKNWMMLYKKSVPRRVPLPTYPFDNKSYFLSPLPLNSQFTQKETFISTSSFDEQFKIIWRNTLKVDGSITENDFFLLGGDSLLALELAEVLRTTFHVEISLRDIFENSSYQALYNLINQKNKSTIGKF